MSKKSSMNARIAAIASKIKMKLNATKIRYTSDVIHGLVRHCRDMQQLSISHQQGPLKLIPAATAERSFLVQESPHHLPQAIRSQLPPNKIGSYG
jgi:hypothetical protein